MNEKLEKILDSINIKNFYVGRGTYKDECCVYNYMEKPAFYADNMKKGTEYTILINLYVKNDIDLKKEKLIEAMNSNGIRGGISQKPQIESNGLYNIPILFNGFIAK